MVLTVPWENAEILIWTHRANALHESRMPVGRGMGCRLALYLGQGRGDCAGSDDGLQQSWVHLTPGWAPQFPPSSVFAHTSSRGGRTRAVTGKNNLWPHVDLKPNTETNMWKVMGGGSLFGCVLMEDKSTRNIQKTTMSYLFNKIKCYNFGSWHDIIEPIIERTKKDCSCTKRRGKLRIQSCHWTRNTCRHYPLMSPKVQKCGCFLSHSLFRKKQSWNERHHSVTR